MSFLDIALACAARGWHVHPLKGKVPITEHGKDDATTDEREIRECWGHVPSANVGISCGPSGLCVLDADHGLADEAAFIAWRDRNGLPVTYAVRSGRRPEFGVQSYYRGPVKDGRFELDGVTGDIKSLGGLVLAAGSVHPSSGEVYMVVVDAPLAATPLVIEQSRKRPAEVKPGEPIKKLGVGEGRHPLMISKAGSLRALGLGEDAILAGLVDFNEQHCADPLSIEELESMAHFAVTRWEAPAPVPKLVMGKAAAPGKKVVTDWREHYHTFDEMENAPPTSFLIDGFLPMDAITALAAPVGQRKSLAALNVAHALCTKERLFDYFTVIQQPTRVLYLCPEMGLRSFTERVRKIGLMPYVGKTLFCRTMSAEGTLALSELTAEELSGAVVIIDTAVRYLLGDENSSEHMRQFAEGIFSLMRGGAASVLLLHHSAKGTKESSELTLENAMRGSGELGAFISSCWATRLQNPDEPYQSASFFTNVKQRDFQSSPFEVTSGPDCRLHIVGVPGGAVLISKATGSKVDKDGKRAAADAIIMANWSLSLRQLVELLNAADIKREKDWVSKAKKRLMAEQFKAMQANGGQIPK